MDPRFDKLRADAGELPAPEHDGDVFSPMEKYIGTLTDLSQSPVEPVHHRRMVRVPRSDGTGHIDVHVYRPEGDGPFPAVLWFHGGGYCYRNKEFHTGTTYSRMVNMARCVLVAPAYRLAAKPENKFPKGQDDCFDTHAWMLRNAAAERIDARRIFTCGESAGGGLSATMALRLRDARVSPPLAGQVILCGFMVPGCETMTHYVDGREAFWLEQSHCRDYWEYYESSPADRLNPHFNVFAASSHTGLPPALLIQAGADPCRDDGIMYGMRLKQSGIDTVSVTYADMPHNFWQWDKVFPTESRQALMSIADFVNSIKPAPTADRLSKL